MLLRPERARPVLTDPGAPSVSVHAHRPGGLCRVRSFFGRERPLESENLQVIVRDNDVGQALRVLKKKLQREGLLREMKRRRAYEKPSERRAREKSEAVRRQRKALRKRLEREGY